MEKEARKAMRVAVYYRLARADQDDTLLEVQKERLRIYAKERGYDIVAEIAEIGSGLSLNRPGIREMAGLAHRHMIDAVLVSDIPPAEWPRWWAKRLFRHRWRKYRRG